MNDPLKPRTLELFPSDESDPSQVHCKEPTQRLERFDLSRYADAPQAPFFQSALGALFDGDCLVVLPWIKSEVVDTVFADPPFNLDKKYGAKSKDNLTEQEYVEWCKAWLGLVDKGYPQFD